MSLHEKKKKASPSFKRVDDLGLGTHERRAWSYYLVKSGDYKLLGHVLVPEGQDVDDAFPAFHDSHFDQEHFSDLESEILNGARLVAVSSSGAETALAYVLPDEPDRWYGREATLKYFGVDFVPAS